MKLSEGSKSAGLGGQGLGSSASVASLSSEHSSVVGHRRAKRQAKRRTAKSSRPVQRSSVMAITQPEMAKNRCTPRWPQRNSGNSAQAPSHGTMD